VTPNRYVDLVHAIVNEGRFEIDTYHVNTIDKSIFQGHYYAGALPGPSFLAVPVYLIFKGIYSLIPENFLSLAGGIQSFKAGQAEADGFYQQVDTVEFFLSQVFLNIFVLAAVSAAGCLFLYRSIVEHGLASSIALKTTFFYAFGSIIFFYSTTFF
jgi:predicted small integral membrane protein